MDRRETDSAFGSRFRDRLTSQRKPALLAWGLPEEFPQDYKKNLADFLPRNAAELVDEMVAEIGATQELIFSLLLGTSAITAQGVFDIQHPNADLKPIPASLYVVCVAGSAQRKSTVLEVLSESITEYQKSQSKNDVQLQVQAAQQRGWKKKCQEIESQIEEHFDSPEKIEELKQRLDALSKLRPECGKSGVNLVNRDTSLSALIQGTEMQSPSTSSVLHEARSMLPLLNRWMATLNELWDGAPIKRDRITMDPVLQFGPRFSIAWIIQPGVWRKYLKSDGVDYLESGLGGRVLVMACPKRTMTGETRRHSIARKARDRHNANMTKLLNVYDEKLKAGKADVRDVLKRSEKANNLFANTCSWIELNMDSNGYFANIPELGGRCAENIMRIAAVLHVIEGCPGLEISEDIMLSAILVMRFMAEQHQKIFGDLRKPVVEVYADKAEEYFLRCFNSGMMHEISVRTIQQYIGSSEIRSKREHVTHALEVLARRGAVRCHYGIKQLESVTLNWNYFDRLRQSFTFLTRC